MMTHNFNINKSLFQLATRSSFVLFFLLTLTPATFAQKESKNVRNGNKLYEKEKYTDAEVEYRKGLNQNNKSFEAQFNLGDALYRQEKYEEAVKQFESAGALATDDKKKLATVNHNIGNSYMQQQKFAEAIEAYKHSLKNNPKDDDTRYNLAYAQQMLQQQQQQEQQRDKQNEDKKDEQKQEQEQEQKRNEQEQNENQQQEQQQNEQQMSKENAEQILEALLQDEKETQEKAKRVQVKSGRKADKDW